MYFILDDKIKSIVSGITLKIYKSNNGNGEYSIDRDKYCYDTLCCIINDTLCIIKNDIKKATERNRIRFNDEELYVVDLIISFLEEYSGVSPYLITYSSGVKQVKNLLHFDSQYIKINQIKDLIYENQDLVSKTKDKAEIGRLKTIIAGYKKDIMAITKNDEWFIHNSPLGRAIDSGKLVLPINQGGTTDCSVVLKDIEIIFNR